MLVYGVTLWLASPSTVESILPPLAKWLARRTRSTVSTNSLLGEGERVLRDGSQLLIARSGTSPDDVLAARYTHADRDVPGRQWILDVGCKPDPTSGDLECCVFLSTSEVSARVTTPIAPTRPQLVPLIAELCRVSNKTCGLTLATLDDESASDFRYVISDPDRTHPLVLISPTSNGNYLLNPARAHSLLLGLADVIQIAATATPYKYVRALGETNAPWDGAVSILYPPSLSPARTIVAPRKLSGDDLAAMREAELDPEAELLSLITHRTNLPHYRRRITVDTARETRLHKELNTRRASALQHGASSEIYAVLEEVNAEQLRKIEELRGERDEALFAQEEALESARHAEFTSDSLRMALSNAGLRDESAQSHGPASEAFRQAIAGLAAGDPNPEQCLTIVSELFRERIIVLHAAWNAAEASRSFKYGTRAFSLLWTLSTEYWEGMCRGEADAQARQCFGNSYAAKDSESVMNNRKARALRTFSYRGAPVEMFKHLKIGVKDSESESLRIHFEWFASEQAIVIGYCGAHLDHG